MAAKLVMFIYNIGIYMFEGVAEALVILSFNVYERKLTDK
jgi:hypothetical protein